MTIPFNNNPYGNHRSGTDVVILLIGILTFALILSHIFWVKSLEWSAAEWFYNRITPMERTQMCISIDLFGYSPDEPEVAFIVEAYHDRYC